MSFGRLASLPLCFLVLALGCSGADSDLGERSDQGVGGSLDEIEASGGSYLLEDSGPHASGGLPSKDGIELGSGGQTENLSPGSGGGTEEGSGGEMNTSGGTGVGGATGGSDNEGVGGASDPAGGASTSGGGENESGCAYEGDVQYELSNPEDWPDGVEILIADAMDEVVLYYNCYSDLSHRLTVKYNEGVPTAEANVDGQISFGKEKNYMVTATAMHEVGHTMGVGFYPWDDLIEGGRWVGSEVNEFMLALPPGERDSDEYSQRDYITADSQHFWPYGLNMASEHESEWSLINHVRIVAAMFKDKQAFLGQ